MSMSIFSILLIALALAMDAFAVSISSGITIARVRVRHALLIASFFGLFQGIMPLAGWHAGLGLRTIIAGWDHWVAFLLLLAVGVKMIYDALRPKGSEKKLDPLNLYVLFVLAVATSIDALAVGIALAFAGVGIVLPVIVISSVTFVTSFLGTYIGAMFGHLLEEKMEIAAGILLIGIGLKILLQHMPA